MRSSIPHPQKNKENVKYTRRNERDALEEGMRKLDGCDMEEFGRLESGEKTIAILGDRWWPADGETGRG